MRMEPPLQSFVAGKIDGNYIPAILAAVLCPELDKAVPESCFKLNIQLDFERLQLPAIHHATFAQMIASGMITRGMRADA